MSGYIYPEKLTLWDAAGLANKLRKADLDDLKHHEAGADFALANAIVEPGEAWSVKFRKDGIVTTIGAGGWTEAGTVWTLWTDLTLEQSKAVLRMLAPYARILAIRAKRPLENYYRLGNNATEKFLRHSRCVDFTGEVRYFNGHYWNHFKLKPLEDLPNV